MLPITTDFAIDALSLACFSTTEEAKQILERIVDMYTSAKSKKNQVAVDTDMDVIIDVIKDLITNDTSLDRKAERNKIILKIKASPLAQKDRMIADNVSEMLNAGASEGMSKKKEDILIKKMQNWALISATNDKLLEGLMLTRKYSQVDETQNDLILMNMLDKASEITKVQDNIIGCSESLDELDFSSRQSMALSASKFAQKRQSNVIHLGLQGLNRMMGKNNGVVRGELCAVGASSHDAKSLMLMSFARWATVLNHYVLNDPSKTPLILFISLENEVSENWKDMATAAYVNANHRPIPAELTKDELIDINYAYYNKVGNKLVMKRYDSDFGFSDLLKLIAHYEARGFEIVALAIDYPALMKLDTLDSRDNGAQALAKLFKRLQDLCHAKDIAGFVGVQLGRNADMLYASGEICPVKKLNADAIADSTAIRRNIDILFFQHIEIVNDVSYLTMQWSKHRGNENVPDTEDKFCAYRFISKELGIPDDFGGKDSSMHDIYADENKPSDDKPKEDFFSQIVNA